MTNDTRAALEPTYQQFRHKAIVEMTPWVEGFDMSRVSVSASDEEAGSPQPGDMIARNPKNHDDKWLVAAAYFADNCEALSAAPGEPIAWQYDLATVRSTTGVYGGWERRLSHEKPNVPEASIRNLVPLYTTPRPAAVWDEVQMIADADYLDALEGELIAKDFDMQLEQRENSPSIVADRLRANIRREAPAEGHMTYDSIEAAFEKWRKTLTVVDSPTNFDIFAQGYVGGWNAKEATRPDTAEARLREALAYSNVDRIAACRCGSFPTLYGDGAKPDDGYRSLWCQTCMEHVTEMMPSASEVIEYWNDLREKEHEALSTGDEAKKSEGRLSRFTRSIENDADWHQSGAGTETTPVKVGSAGIKPGPSDPTADRREKDNGS